MKLKTYGRKESSIFWKSHCIPIIIPILLIFIKTFWNLLGSGEGMVKYGNLSFR